DPGGPQLPDVLIPVANNQSLDSQRAVRGLLDRAGPMLDALPETERQAGHARLAETSDALDRYYRQPGIRNTRLMRAELVVLRNFMQDSVPLLLDASLNDQQEAGGA